MPRIADDRPPSTANDIEVCVRSAVEARELAVQGWATAIVSLVDRPGLEVERPDGLLTENHLVLQFADVTSAEDGVPVTAAHMERLIVFARGLPSRSRVLVHCSAGIGRSPACALGIHLARGHRLATTFRRMLVDRPAAQPNPLVVLELDELLGATGRVWRFYHRWAQRQPWWRTTLHLHPHPGPAAVRAAVAMDSHKRPRRPGGPNAAKVQ